MWSIIFGHFVKVMLFASTNNKCTSGAGLPVGEHWEWVKLAEGVLLWGAVQVNG